MKIFKFLARKKSLQISLSVAVLVVLYAIIAVISTKKTDESTVAKRIEAQPLVEETSKINDEIGLSEDSNEKIKIENSDPTSTPKGSHKESEKKELVHKNETPTEIKVEAKTVGSKNEKLLNFSDWNRTCAPTLVVVNKDNPIPEDYPISLETYNGKKINAALKDDLNAMINAAAKDGIKIFIYSGYRTIEEQTRYFNSQTSMYKKQGYSEQDAQAKAAMSVARPRTSEHNTGLAIDFNCVRDDFYKTKEYAWLIKNAAEYGFILRYAKDKTDKTGVIYEPWHFRYVGKDHAPKIMASGLCLEEYIASLIKK